MFHWESIAKGYFIAIERFDKSNDLFRRRYKMLSPMYLY